MSSDAIVHLLQRSGESQVEATHEVKKTPKFSYTRDFLLSLKELDICKRLPAGFESFDSSILSESDEVPSNAFDRQRNLGGPLQVSRYGSTTLKRADGTVSYSRGSHSRWDTQSTGSSDKDCDSQPYRDLLIQDSGSHYLNQPRRPWLNPERDGLLGSGAFPRLSGHHGGALVPKGRGSVQNQLSRSSDRYQPPRPYKAAPYSWRESTDSYNDETFGSSECSSQQRVEEERKRRASFELMRKEQQKALQENQKPSDKCIEDLDSDIVALLGTSKSEKNLNDNEHVNFEGNAFETDPGRGPFPAHTSASRPPVPPGFASTITEKNIGAQALNKTLQSGVGIVGIRPLLSNGSLMINGDESNLEKGHASGVDVHPDRTTCKSNGSAFAEHPLVGLEPENDSMAACGSFGADGNWEQIVCSSNEDKFSFSGNTDRCEEEQPISILDKLFDNTSPKDNENGLRSIEEWSPTSSQSSKYVQWFSEIVKKPAEDHSSRDLLSLIINTNNNGSKTSVISKEHIFPQFPSENGEASQESISCVNVPRLLESYDHHGKPDTDSGVLTCEDLEQSILADAKESGSSFVNVVQRPWNTVDANFEKTKADVDDHASQHLLSLLHKGLCSKDDINPEAAQTFEGPGNVKPEITHVFVSNNFSEAAGPARIEKPLTLEALFGSAFMQELHSMEAPVSGHRGSVDESVDHHASSQVSVLPPAHANYTSSSEYVSEAGPQERDSWMGFEELQSKKSVPSHFVARENGSLGIQLPEEESLITVGDAVTPIVADPFPLEITSKNMQQSCARRPDETLMDKLAALNIPKNSDGYPAPELDAPSLHGSYHMVDPGFLYHNARPSTPQFPHGDHIKSLFQPSDNPTYGNPLMNPVSPDMIHHDAHFSHHQFSSNDIHYHPFQNPGGPMFDSTNLPIPSPMPVPGNFLPRQPLHGFPRGIPLSHSLSHMSAYMPEISPMQSFPRQHGFGVGIPGASSSGVGDPESFKRLMMEMRTNLKQSHASVPGHVRGMFSHELDMRFR